MEQTKTPHGTGTKRDEEQPDPSVPPELEEKMPLLADSFCKATDQNDSQTSHDQMGALIFVLKVGLPPVALFIIGVVFLMIHEDWPLLTSCYVITQIITTIGYGDFTVTHSHSKLFIALYSLCLLAILAYYVNLFVAKMIAWESDLLRAHLRRLEVDWGLATSEKEAKKKYGELNVLVVHVALVFVVMVTGMGCSEKDFKTCAETGGFVKTWIDLFYMSVITLSTIGFGDYQPRSEWGRCFGIFWMIFGVGATAATVSKLSMWMFERGRRKKFATADAVGEIDRQVFESIDKDNSGTLSRGEFLTYTLLKYNLVDEKLLADINSLYDGLDSKGTNAVSYDRILQAQEFRAESKN